ncbi:hypothetical protein PLESTB_000986200 [Pleodorina starrii]|uniref:Uncharacterized protein n=1 Tax=Pleodorina starrii TaxID=330485 RepID=A0A9W6BNT7_9CHLO|nr:hypothetical protein PLESTM_000548800 [Pleodorina starrii]GLC55428.1 hypothetical protein PLESTB_000986200 [Pleodorina starrii]GLC73821.1 hypothetical protein PLESTF_001424600 [Pleodorina starrii]
MLRNRRLLANFPALNSCPWPFIAFGVLLGLAYLQLLVGHFWQQWHHKLVYPSPLAGELTRVLTDLAARDAGQPVDTALDVTCHDISPLTYTNNPTVNAVLLARRSGLVLPCNNAELQNFNLSICAGKCIIAANFYNSEAVLPNMVVQLVRVAKLLGPANILVSIYESGSVDATPEWLQLLGALLRAMSVRFIITAGGNLTRSPGQDRIAFLSSVRQAAISQVQAACGGTAAEFCHASRIVFVNDVFFDATGLIRLLQYDSDDVVCGLDFEPILADHSLSEQQQFMAQHLQRIWRAPSFLAERLAAWKPAFRLWRRRYRRDNSLLRLLPLFFYDIWVARDVGGGRFYRQPPYTRHEPTAARMQAGLPVSAYCCWNGLVALQGHPLLSRRVSFRAHTDGECYASECSLLCDDLHSQGPTRVVIDPGVRVSYRAVAAEHMYGVYGSSSGGGVGAASGLVVAAAPAVVNSSGPVAPVDLPYVPWNRTMLDDLAVWRRDQGLPSMVDCCGMTPGSDSVDFENGCARVPVSRLAPKAMLQDSRNLNSSRNSSSSSSRRRTGERRTRRAVRLQPRSET